jgi:dUTP pyrophosphatase
LIPTGIAIHIADNNVAGLIIPRSGLGAKQGIVLGNGTGLIDSDYQGEIFVSLWNRGLNPFKVESGDRIAQLFFVPVITPTFKIVNNFESITDRADGGFGSTGTE